MSGHEIDRLSDYLDGGLSVSERTTVEDHLADCAECAATLEDLREVVATAAALEDTPPERDLWPGIEARLAERRAVVVPLEVAPPARRRFSFSLPQLAAAVVAALLIGVGGAWIAFDGGDAAGPTTAEAPSDERAPIVPVGAGAGESAYAEAIATLEAELAARRDGLDPETLETVEQNLAIIDGAILEIRAALDDDPDDPYLNRHLATTMQRKVDVLRQATQAAL